MDEFHISSDNTISAGHCTCKLPVQQENGTKKMAEEPTLSNFEEEVGMGVQRNESNGHQTEMGIV